MNVQFKKGVLELCVLVLLDKQDRYGYELVQKISEQIDISEGSAYPLLRRLTKEGYFTTYLRESTEGPPRKYYKLTDNGRTYLYDLLQEWKEFTKKRKDSIKEDIKDGWAKNEEDGLKRTPISDVIPFRLRGSKLIENWEDAKQAAINLSRYLS